MDFASNYEIARTVDYIRSRNFTRVALQFPDELLKDSTRVVRELREELSRSGGNVSDDVGLYVMADTAYGSCCVDEVGASHISADCVVHYGHTCLSPTSTLPAFFVFGRASINVDACAKSLCDCLSTSDKPIMVLYGLQYVHAVENIKEAVIVESSKLGQSNLAIYYSDVISSDLNPLKDNKTDNRQLGSFNNFSSNGEVSDSVDGRSGQQMNSTTGTSYSLGGLTWNLPEGRKMGDCLLFWIGSDNPAFANFVLTFNDCEIVRYDADRNCFLKDSSHQKRILKRRYYLVEKAKDANIIGILVGTLGVAGYLHMIHQMKDLIKGVGKKAYILVMGKPNPAKLANFPECDVFIYVSCAQTALLDSKEFLAPVITPFEAMLAFNRGSQWTGEYVLEFRDLMASSLENGTRTEEARFSFLQGGYVEDLQVEGEQEEVALALAEATEKSLKVQDKNTSSVFVKGTAKSGAEFLAARSYRGLEVHNDKLSPRSFIMGRSGKASGYEGEKNKQEDL